MRRRRFFQSAIIGIALLLSFFILLKLEVSTASQRFGRLSDILLGAYSPLFLDGFESGNLNAWETVSGLQVLSSESHTGEWTARGTSSSIATYARKTLTLPQTDLYYRTFVKVISQSENSVYIMRFRTSGTSSASIVGVYINSSGVLAYRNDVAETTKLSSGYLTDGVWHEVQAHVRVNGTFSLVELWLDGTLVSSNTESLGDTAIGMIQLGENSTGQRSFDIAFDDLIVDTTYISSSAEIATPVVDSISLAPKLSEVVIGPIADAYVDFASPDTNFGTETSLIVDSNPNMEGFLRFDVSGSTGAISKAKLRLYVRDTTDIGPLLFGTSNNWTETGITWSNKPTSVGSSILVTGTFVPNSWIEYDVTKFVTGNGIYSFNLVPMSANAAVFTSQESGATTQHPQLVVTFDPSTPETAINSGPSSISTSDSASFTFSANNQPDTLFECTLDGSAFALCTSPQTYTGLSDGSHTFQVRAQDIKGRLDPSPASRAWTIDTTAPMVNYLLPAEESSNVATSADIVAKFSEVMDASTVSATNFLLVQQGSDKSIPAMVSYDFAADQAVLNPDTNLVSDATYTATVKGGVNGLKDEAGNTIIQDRVWSFTTGVAQTIIFNPIADAKVESGHPTMNYGIDTILKVDSSPLIESYVQFAVAGFPHGITSAKLQLWVTDATKRRPNLYIADNAWTETGITWNTKPVIGVSTNNTNAAIEVGTLVEYGVTPFVKGDGTYTFALVGGASKDSASFGSREAVHVQRPKLIVTYDPSLDDVSVSASPKGGTYTLSQLVTLTTPEQNAIIYYTTDNSDPRPGSSSHVRHKYLGPLNIPVDTPLKFVAVSPDGRMSKVMQEVYTINITNGYEGRSRYGANVNDPTGSKEESKLWFNDGSWWGVLYSRIANEYRIYRFDLSTQSWVDTGTTVDTRENSRADTLWDGSKLYISSGTTYISEWGNPATADVVAAGSGDLLRFSYNPTTKIYSLDTGFPVTIRPGSAESMSITRDSTGQLWIAYTAITYAGGSPVTQVWVNHSLASDTEWGVPFVPPIAGTTANYDDIATIIAFGSNKVGLMWANQNDKKFYFSVHNDGDADNAWQPTETAYGGGVGGCYTGCANDHLNIKSDSSGRIFVGIKTANRNTGQPFIVLLVRGSAGDWTPYTFGHVEDEHSRPCVLIDEEHQVLYLFATIRETGGAIFYKTIPLNNLMQGFATGPGISIIQNPRDHIVNDATSTKQNLNSATGLLLLATDNSEKRYLYNYLSLIQ